MMNLIPWEMCFCGCKDFFIRKPGRWWEIVCQNCKCVRKINSPGIAVSEYAVSVPFKVEEVQHDR